MFLVENGATVRDLVLLILNKFEVINVEEVVGYFGLFESLNGQSIGDSRKLDDNVVDIVTGWSRSTATANAKFIFMVRLYEPCTFGIEHKDVLERRLGCKTPLTDEAHRIQAETRDPGLIHLQYLQAVYSVITGQYPTSVELALKLGMLHFTYKFGSFNAASHKVGFLGARIVEFIPIKHLKSRPLEAWESALIEAVKAHHTSYEAAQSDGAVVEKDDVRTQRQYLNEVFNLVQFGCTMFRCKVNSATTTAATAKSIPLDCFLGIQSMGIHIFDKSSSRTLVATYRIDEIFRWGFRAGEMFYFEVQANSPEESGVVEFDTIDGEKISVLLTDYAHAFVTEVERIDKRSAKARVAGKSKAAAENGTTTGGAAAENETEEESKPQSTTTGKSEKSSKSKGTKVKKIVALPKGALPPPVAAMAAMNVDGDSVSPPSPPAAASSAEVKAAVRVQSTFRGYRDRCLVSAMIEKLLEDGEL